MLLLASRVARFVPAPFLALRYLDETLAVLERQNAGADKIADLVGERMELPSCASRHASIRTHAAGLARSRNLAQSTGAKPAAIWQQALQGERG